jgi:hypothetical protein
MDKVTGGLHLETSGHYGYRVIIPFSTSRGARGIPFGSTGGAARSADNQRQKVVIGKFIAIMDFYYP